jgi:PAS domain S-box-containing protein
MNEGSFLLSKEMLDKVLPGHILVDDNQKVASMGTLASELFGESVGVQMEDILVFEDIDGTWIAFSYLIKYAGKMICILHKKSLVKYKCKVNIEGAGKYILLNLEKQEEYLKSTEVDHAIMASLDEHRLLIKELKSLLVNTQLRFEKVIDDSLIGLLIEDEQRNIVNVNETFCQMFQIDLAPENLIGLNCAESAEQSKHLFKEPEDFVDRVREILDSKVAVYNDVLELKDGRFLRRDYLPLYIDMKYTGHMWKYFDITESRSLELRLQKQKKFYEKILNNLPADIAVFDSEHHYLFVNPKGIKDNELREWIVGKTDFDYCNYKNKDISIAHRRRALFNETVASKVQRRWEEHLVDKEGNDRYLMRMMHPTYTDSGELDMVIGYGLDITERKKIELRVAQSESRFRGLFEKSPALISIHDLNGKLIDVNQTTLDVLGYSKDELLGKSLGDFLRQEGRLHIENDYKDIIEREGKDEGISVARTKAGEDVHLLYQNHLVSINNEEPYILGFAQDITASIMAELELKKSEEKYKRIIESMNLGLVEIDINGHIIYANSCFCQMTSYSQDDLINKSVAQVYETLNSDINVQDTLSKRLSGEYDSYEMMITDKNGIQKWMLVSGAPVRDKNGMVKGAIGIHLEITKQKLLEADLRKAKDDAENSAQAKEMFLANMSHEIRTPLNAIIGIGGLLAKTKINEQQSFFLSTIQTAAQNLLVIINDLLDFSKMESGNLSFEEINFSITDLLRKTKQVLLYKAEEKGLSVDFDFDPAIAPILIGDPYRLNQVILNIVTNAIKFTEKGAITILCSVVSEEADIQHVMIEIRDTGIGISEEFINSLFDKFAQEDNTITRKYGGTGLGMSISKELIEMMGGSLEVKSKKNVGTSFFVKLKLKKGQQSLNQISDVKQLNTDLLKEKKILLVEDNEMNRLLATTLLGHYGVEVDEAEDGKVAITKFNSKNYDLILMDLQMPEMDGLQATEYIRKHLDSTIPIIALTANVFKEEQERCFKVGMNDFISKPFEENSFIQMITKWIIKSAETNPNRDEVEAKEPLLFNVEQLLKMGKNDQEFLKKMLQIYTNTMPETLAKMKDAFTQKEWMLIASLAHRIKASLAGMGVISIADDIKNLEAIKMPLMVDENIVQTILNKVVSTVQQSIVQIRMEYPHFFD